MLRKFLFSVLIITGLMAGIVGYSLVRADFTTDDGVSHQWKNYEGQWVVVNYFAQWCAPCLREIPQLNHFYQQNSSDVPMFAISFDAVTPEELAHLKQKFDIQFPLIETVDRALPMTRPSSLPATFIIGPDGQVKKQLLGEQTAASLRRTIDILKTL